MTISMPIWVRVSGIIALVLVGVVVSSMLLGSTASGGQHGGRGQGSRRGREVHMNPDEILEEAHTHG